MKRRLAAVLPALVMALLLGLSVFFVACDSGTESGGQNTEQSGEEQEGTEQGGGNEGETGGESGEEDETGGETGEESGGETGDEGETGGEDPAPVPDVSDKLVFTLNDEGTANSVTDMDTSAAGSVTIPSTYNGLPVTSIDSSAFAYCNSLVEITIPEGVTSIGSFAFSNCSGLAEITIPASVTSIGGGAFQSCSGLTKINYNAASVAGLTINSRVFQNAGSNSDGITVIFGESVTSVPAYLFYRNSSDVLNLVSVTIGNNVTSIGSSAFYGCSSLMEITIPANVTSIGRSAFRSCSNLTSVTFENTEGWWYASSSGATSGREVASSDLADPSTAATYLKSTYYNYYWYRA